MNITDEQREQVARLEAKLRDLYPGMYRVRFQEHPGGNHWRLETDTWDGPATPPDTAGGREWWCEALRLNVFAPKYGPDPDEPDRPMLDWMVTQAIPLSRDRSRTEAIQQAILAAAAEHAKGDG